MLPLGKFFNNYFKWEVFMDHLLIPLSKCILFKNIKTDCLKKTIGMLAYHICEYPKDSTIAIEDDNCNQLGILLKGLLTVQTIYPSGKVLTLTQIGDSDIFGEVVLFSQAHQYPATITSLKDSKVLFIGRKALVELLSEHPCIMENFLSLLSNKLLMLNRKVKLLSLESIRQKISNYLLTQYKNKNSHTFSVSLSRKEMAEHMGIPRPSLSRELMKMKEEGIIDFEKNSFTIKDLDALEC